MIAWPPIETAVDCPRPAAESVLQISVVMPPERDMTPIGPFVNARRTFTAGPPRAPLLASSGARNPLGHDEEQLPARLDRLEDGVAREARGHRDDRAVDPDLRRDVAHAVV